MSEFPALTISLACSPLRMRVRECANQCRKLYSSWVLCKKLKYSHADPGLASGFAKIPRVFLHMQTHRQSAPKMSKQLNWRGRESNTHTHIRGVIPPPTPTHPTVGFSPSDLKLFAKLITLHPFVRINASLQPVSKYTCTVQQYLQVRLQF